LPPEAVPLVRVGHETGTLPAAISKAITAHNLFEPVWQTIVPKIGYVCILPSLAVGIVAFIMLKIVPQFEKIFHDFGMRLPGITRAVIYVCIAAGHWWFLVGAAWLFAISLLFYCMLRYAGWIRWDLPGMAWLTRRRHTAMLLDGVSLAAQQQQPLAKAVMQLAAGYPQRTIARRLWDAYDAIQAGGNELETLYRHGLLGQSDLALLQSALRNGNLAWAAGELADSNRRRMIYRTNAVVQLVFPPIIVAYALAVVSIAAALFVPLVVLIQNLSGPL
jgi:type II secretory pathway component PulF